MGISNYSNNRSVNIKRIKEAVVIGRFVQIRHSWNAVHKDFRACNHAMKRNVILIQTLQYMGKKSTKLDIKTKQTKYR